METDDVCLKNRPASLALSPDDHMAPKALLSASTTDDGFSPIKDDTAAGEVRTIIQKILSRQGLI